ADFKKLGPRYGKVMKDLGKAITAMTADRISLLEREGKIEFPEISGSPVITLEDVEIIPEDVPGWLVANEGNVTVALDVTVTDALRNEGLARDLINRIQNIRKESDFAITDRVKVILSDTPEVSECLAEYKDYIASQVLADSIELAAEVPAPAKELDIDGMKILANVVR
ncbi:MAG: isoleucine--tRNA ligase, partial [Muribaculaceae bacterium]|nr:isoleucine--tRNA ligase [Muribaculaceae bacterium]